MKKLFYGLAAAAIALSASAFTNAKPEPASGGSTTIYVTGKITDPITLIQYYTYNTSGSGVTCNSNVSPCQLNSKSGYTLPPDQFPVSDYTPANFSTETQQPQL